MPRKIIYEKENGAIMEGYMKYDDLKTYYDSNISNMNEILNRIEKDIVDARDSQNVPIYMTRARVKDIDSCYLKTKRKNKIDIDTITDMIGLRILCLFEQDIFDVYQYLLTMLNREVYTLKEILVYGWKKDSIVPIDFMQKEFNKFDRYSKVKFEDIYRDNGYQSIHFVGLYKDFHQNIEYSFEIQLRTLLQDVWGELEHKLAYKQKNPHQFIRQSFMRLSKSLETNDMLITHLKSFIDESLCGIDPISFSVGNVYKYEDQRLPEIFKQPEIEPILTKYNKLILKADVLKDKAILKAAYSAYKELISSCMKHAKYKFDDSDFIYWKEMEEAFFKVINEEFTDAIRIYEKYLDSSYVSAFRLGQIYFHQKNHIEALKKFDQCFEILDHESLQINKMKLYVNMALIFWNLGTEYLISAVESIDKAIENSKECDERDLEVLYNSACYYYMECLLNERCCNKVEDTHEKSEAYYNILKELVDKFQGEGKYARKHTYDTLAWYNYNKYILSGKQDIVHIEKAHDYMLLMNNGIMPVVQYYSHEAIQQSHMQKIKCEFSKI